MIQLFNIPQYTLDTSWFSNLLHDKVVREFEERFAAYVGAKYAVSFNSATSAIFLIFSHWKASANNGLVTLPSIIPPVVPNALLNAGWHIRFNDNVNWVGGDYVLHRFPFFKVIDSAQRVDRDQFKNEAEDPDLMLFSFYPTKPVGSCDGGMVVSNDKAKIDALRTLTFNGMSTEVNNWERKQINIGHKMYMNSIQAFIANENLKRLDEKKLTLDWVRDSYNSAFGLSNSSYHLYRIEVQHNKSFIQEAKEAGIICGMHYEAAHLHPIYHCDDQELPVSEFVGLTTVSIPFHEEMDTWQVNKVIEFVNENR